MTVTGRPGPVVVGTDHSSDSAAVVSYAAWEAQRRGTDLLLIHGYVAPEPDDRPYGPLHDDNELIVMAEERLSEVAGELVRSPFPAVAVRTKVVAGSGAMALVNESPRAALIVVGARGRGGFEGLRLGSVATQVSRHARCPVMVIRPGRARDREPWLGPVVVGVDGSAPSTDALRFGFDEATARQVRLIAAHVWSVPALAARTTGTVWSPRLRSARAQLEQAAGEVLDAALSGWSQKYPEVEVERRCTHGDEPARALLATADEVDAGLIVAGSRPAEGAVTVLGAVSQTLVEYARTSVAVVGAEPSLGG